MSAVGARVAGTPEAEHAERVAELMRYRFGPDVDGEFWRLYYPRTEAMGDAEILALIDCQAPGYDSEPLGDMLPRESDAAPERAAAAARFGLGDPARRTAAYAVLSVHVARLYARHNPEALEAAYSAALELQWAEAAAAAGLALGPDGDPVNPTPEAMAAADAAYDSAPFVQNPGQRAVAAARAAVAAAVGVLGDDSPAVSGDAATRDRARAAVEPHTPTRARYAVTLADGRARALAWPEYYAAGGAERAPRPAGMWGVWGAPGVAGGAR